MADKEELSDLQAITTNIGDERERVRLGLHELASRIDAQLLFVSIFAKNALAPSGEAREATHGHLAAQLELAAFELYPFFGRSAVAPTPIDVMEGDLAVQQLFRLEPIGFALGNLPRERPSAADDVARRVQLQAGIVRGSAYPSQTRREILEITGPFEAWFEEHAGILPARAIAILEAITSEIEDGATEHHRAIHDTGRAAVEAWRGIKRKKKHERSVANLDELLRDTVPASIEGRPPGRNERCVCGSGKKFKHCCIHLFK